MIDTEYIVIRGNMTNFEVSMFTCNMCEVKFNWLYKQSESFTQNIFEVRFYTVCYSKFELECIAMTATMLNADSQACGSLTSGGTESILMAVKTYRWDKSNGFYTKMEHFLGQGGLGRLLSATSKNSIWLYVVVVQWRPTTPTSTSRKIVLIFLHLMASI